ncbi:DNA-3-methyladenine glycosylase [Ruminococcaceae bacterium OttesenSCG-928-L11]|nr:DNA-3-methyladenine glycosylase [Ruminococcaceae bacterium OttesenSCG-928-L11]
MRKLTEYGEKLDRDFYMRDAVQVAVELLGKRLIRVVDGVPLVAEITETEAYTGVNDKASHAYGGRLTQRTRVMYQIGGYAYIYLIYGIHSMLNVVTGPKNDPCCVLIRMAEPLEGLDSIALNRYGKEYDKLGKVRRKGLLDGPGKICQGFGLRTEHSGMDLTGDELFLAEPREQNPRVVREGKRINIDYAEEAADFLYRFYVE